jgi:stage IV sporulation protein A
VPEKYYYESLSAMVGTTIENEYQLVSMIRELSGRKNEYAKVSDALSDCMVNGYSVVIPQREKISLNEPEVFRNGQRFGVKIQAEATTIYMIQTAIQTEIAPIVGSEQQAKDLIAYINQNSTEKKDGIWETNIFGKTVEQIVDDGIQEKIHNITDENIEKIRETLQKVMNENTGLVCIIV